MKHHIKIQGQPQEWSWSRGGEIVHEIGPYSIVECRIDADTQHSFHPFVDGRVIGSYARSLDEALIAAMVWRRGPECRGLEYAIGKLLS